MKKISLLLIVLICATFYNVICAQTFDYSKLQPHPRFIMHSGQEKEVKKGINSYKPFVEINDMIYDFCDKTIDEPVVVYEKRGKRLLSVSQMAKKRIIYLSYAYRMSGKKKYADRAIKEMLAVAEFSDWNPSHFLDVGEMSCGVSIGYDWLYDYMSKDEELIIRTAIIEKALKAGLKRTFGASNWNSVCNSGLIYGALAIFEHDKEFAIKMIERCVENNHKVMECYGPDGGYPEGYSYWNFGTGCQTMLINALDSALGDDNGLKDAAGYLQSAYFMQYMTGATGESYCYSDGTAITEVNMMIFWFADQLKDNSVLWIEKQSLESGLRNFSIDNVLPAMLIFASKIDMKSVEEPVNNYWINRGDTPIFAYREGWKSKEDTYLAVKAGSTSVPHSHIDIGSFIFEKDGVRWCVDLGKEDYGPLEATGIDYWNFDQNSSRWTVFRNSNEAHSTLVVDGQNQYIKGVASFTETYKTKNKKGVKIDMNQTYSNTLKGATRTIWLDKKDNLTILDQLTGDDDESEVKWILNTSAKAKIISDNIIELTKDGKILYLKADAENPIELKIWSNQPKLSVETKNEGCRVGFITTVKANEKADIKVELIEKL